MMFKENDLVRCVNHLRSGGWTQLEMDELYEIKKVEDTSLGQMITLYEVNGRFRTHRFVLISRSECSFTLDEVDE